jgi:hypothetical protein
MGRNRSTIPGQVERTNRTIFRLACLQRRHEQNSGSSDFECRRPAQNCNAEFGCNALDELLAPELVFTNHLWQLLAKEDDLAAHRSGVLKVKELKPSEQHVRLYGDITIVSVRMQLSGAYDGNPANGDFRFTRVWALS